MSIVFENNLQPIKNRARQIRHGRPLFAHSPIVLEVETGCLAPLTVCNAVPRVHSTVRGPCARARDEHTRRRIASHMYEALGRGRLCITSRTGRTPVRRYRSSARLREIQRARFLQRQEERRKTEDRKERPARIPDVRPWRAWLATLIGWTLSGMGRSMDTSV